MTRFGAGGARALVIVGMVAAIANISAVPASALAPTPAVTASDYGYPYANPPDCDEVTGANCVEDVWGFVQGQCHSWVAYRLNELDATELQGDTFDTDFRMTGGNEWGNPPNWVTAAAEAGITTNTTPALGSVAWWASDGGHVAYVEAVNSDGSITVSEMNLDWHNGFDFATLRPDDARWPDTFIHIADRPPNVAATPAAPGTPHAVGASGLVTVSWTAPTDDGGAPITGYSVVVSPTGQVVKASAAARSAAVASLQPGSYRFTVRASNSAGTGASSQPSNTVVLARSRAGYWMLGATGSVYAFGDAVRYGDAPHATVAMAARRDGLGYWTVDGRGRVHSFGAATARGGSPVLRVGESVSSIAATPSGNGYWLFTNQGRAFRFGDAHVYGDMSNVHLNGPIIASAVTATGKGYYMVGSDGGVFSFGDAAFHGSTGAMHLNKPVVGIAPTRDNRGYWLVASDGGVFAFGASFRGSMGRAHLNQPVNGLVAFGNGYLMVAADGGIFNFSSQGFYGSLGGQVLPAPIIGVSAFATG